jgi:hypothetical protein
VRTRNCFSSRRHLRSTLLHDRADVTLGYIMLNHRIGGVMVSLLVSRVVDRVFEPRSDQTKFSNDVILYIHSVHIHRGNSFQRQNYKMRLKQRSLNWINFFLLMSFFMIIMFSGRSCVRAPFGSNQILKK